jgi:NADH-quinone oxidoreductase subunit M
MSFPWLTVIGVLPMVGAGLTWLLPSSRSKPLSFGTSLLTLALVLTVAVRFDVGGAERYQFAETYSWIPQLGVSYALGVDGIALSMLALTAVLVPVCLLAGWNEVTGEQVKSFFAMTLILESFMFGAFMARDVFMFYVFFEAMLIPAYFLIGGYGGEQRRYAAVKFLVYSLVGGLLMLVAVIGVYAQGPGGSDGFLTGNLTGIDYGSDITERLLFLGFFVAFAIKAPMVPVHTWLPDAAAEAPSSVAVLVVGVLDKVGTFGMLTLCLPLFPDASRWATPAVVVLAVISIVYGGLLAIGQRDLKRLIGYTSISHFGFIVLGVFAMTTTSQSGAALYMVNHGFSTAALFLIGGMLIARRGSQRIDDFGGLQRSTPLLAGGFMLAGLSSLALPGLSSFISEILVLIGTYTRYPAAGIVATSGLLLSAMYILLTYQRMFTGPVRAFAAGWRDMDRREAWVIAPVIAAILVLGAYPKRVLDVLNPAVARTMQQVGLSDPAPTNGTVAGGRTP